MENILLFNVEINPQYILSPELTMNVDINGYSKMTTEEVEEFNELIGKAAQLVIKALIRGMQEKDGED